MRDMSVCLGAGVVVLSYAGAGLRFKRGIFEVEGVGRRGSLLLVGYS